jgi:hypothetical protein
VGIGALFYLAVALLAGRIRRLPLRIQQFTYLFFFQEN